MKPFCLFGILLCLLACQSWESISFTKPPEIISNAHSAAPLTAYLDFSTDKPYQKVIVSLSDGDKTSALTYDFSEKTENGYLLMLMKPNHRYSIEIQLENEQGQQTTIGSPVFYTPPPLPEGDREFPRIVVGQLEASEMEGGLTLINPRRQIPRSVPDANKLNKSFGMLAMINAVGEVLWYYKTDSRISDFDLLPNGHISYMTQDSRIREIDFAGNIIAQWYAKNRHEGPDPEAIPVDALTFHHDVSLLPNGHRLALSSEYREVEGYYSSGRDANAPRKTQQVMGDIVVEFTPDGEIVHQWNCFDHLPVYRIGYETFSGYWERRGFPGVIDWSHANAVIAVPGEEAFLVNFRYQSAMIKVDKSSGDIQWIFAEPSAWGKDLEEKLLQLPPGEAPWHQHSPHFTRNGNLLFFNNNNYQARPFETTVDIRKSPSFVVEYEIDLEKRTARKVWTSEIEGEEPIISVAMGRVSELPQTGNILAGYGAIVSQANLDEMDWWNRAQFRMWTMVREYTHTFPATVVWELRVLPRHEESPVGWTLFGAERIPLSFYSETSSD
ncbi:MAG: aryl-sulfate sulfotransferase [Bacteroidota bacterium]